VETIILASGSANRRALLDQVKIPYRVIVSEIDEQAHRSESIEERVKRLAIEKTVAVAGQLKEKDRRWLVGFDTLIKVEDRIVGKPGNREEAREILMALSGRMHRIVTAVALLPNPEEEVVVGLCSTSVAFKSMTDDEIEYYLKTNEWQDAAGAYRIQSRGAFFVESLKGSYSNVVGLPLSVLYGMLRRAGYLFS
jgi:septum formation protein